MFNSACISTALLLVESIDFLLFLLLLCLPPALFEIVAVVVSKLLPFDVDEPVVLLLPMETENDEGELMGEAEAEAEAEAVAGEVDIDDCTAGEVDIDECTTGEEFALFDNIPLLDDGEENFDDIESISEGAVELGIAVELDDDDDDDDEDEDDDGLPSFFDEDRNENVPEGVILCLKKLLI